MSEVGFHDGFPKELDDGYLKLPPRIRKAIEEAIPKGTKSFDEAYARITEELEKENGPILTDVIDKKKLAEIGKKNQKKHNAFVRFFNHLTLKDLN
ncbi:hypothetical protein [Levilactobacillus spicheri]|nr:hypothetical protein [Levilactobacillus spicheri]GEO66229.1 hypothetical protein LSP04_06480 [Levilactobacillus spicheri]